MLSSSPQRQSSLAWTRGNVWSKHKGSYGLILVRFFLSGGKISNCRRLTGGRHKSVSARPQAEDVFQAPFGISVFLLKRQPLRGWVGSEAGLRGLSEEAF